MIIPDIVNVYNVLEKLTTTNLVSVIMGYNDLTDVKDMISGIIDVHSVLPDTEATALINESRAIFQ